MVTRHSPMESDIVSKMAPERRGTSEPKDKVSAFCKAEREDLSRTFD